MQIWFLRKRIGDWSKVPIAAVGIRGTEFEVVRFADDSGEIWVIDGEVEITFPGKEDPLIVKSGYKCSFNNKGASAPIPFVSIDRWWEK